MPTTSISAGKIIRKMLLADPKIAGIVSRVFPVVVDMARLPYIAYRRISHVPSPYKVGNADAANVEVLIFAADYDSSVEIAEAVRAALDCRQGDAGDGLKMRNCTFTDGAEDWQDDAYVQRLVFTIKV